MDWRPGGVVYAGPLIIDDSAMKRTNPTGRVTTEALEDQRAAAAYLHAALAQARYKILADGTVFGSIPGFQGVWADEPTFAAAARLLVAKRQPPACQFAAQRTFNAARAVRSVNMAAFPGELQQAECRPAGTRKNEHESAYFSR